MGNRCIHCGETEDFIKKGKNIIDGVVKYRIKCKSCGRQQYATDSLEKESSKNQIEIRQKFAPSHIKNGKRFVITSIQNNTETHDAFFRSLELFCVQNDAELIVIPLIYEENHYEELLWDIEDDYLVHETFSLNNMITVLGDMNTIVTALNPISALENLSKGTSLIVPHNQLQMKSLPVIGDNPAIILCSTGTISKTNYPQTKSGRKAKFNHSNSAVFLDFESDMYHLRVLNGDENGSFYDITGFYNDFTYEPVTQVEALITGDEHVSVRSKEVEKATYTNSDSIVNVLKPKIIVRHDVLDSFTISHHHVKDHFIQYSKFVSGFNKIEDELNETIKFIIDTTPSFSTTYLIASNHNDHLKRWLTEADPKREPWNAKIFHKLTLLMLDEIDKNPNSIYKPDPFELYCNNIGANINFMGRNESFKIHDIELSLHGDVGSNGSRGSLTQFSKFADKTVIGHSHSAGIDKGCYQVGCSTSKDLEYTKGISSWLNTHCVIYPNGKRQLINIINGKWK